MPDLINTLTPAVDYSANELTPTGYLSATIDIIVYAHNYNDLSNKPSINSITLSGNKTASDLGLAVPSDITVTSVNTKTGAVVLDGTDINYDTNTSINAKINDIESQIASSGVLSVNGETGIVSLDANDIPYSTGVSTKAKIDAIEQSIPVVNYPVTSVNTKTGAVVLDGSDIKYDSNTTINAKIDAVEGEIPTVDYPVTSVNGQTGDVTISVPTTDNDITHYIGTPTAGSTAEAIGNCATKAYVDNGTTPTVTITGKTGVGVWNVISTPIVRGGAVNIVMFFEVTGGGLPTVTHNISCTRTISKLDMIAVNLDSTNTVRTGSYDNGTIKFNNTLGNGKYLAIGTLLFT